jgi:hypothetical protein
MKTLPEPWPEPVDGAELLQGIQNMLRERTSLTKDETLLGALYISATWACSPFELKAFREAYPTITENPFVKELTHPDHDDSSRN